MLSGFAEPDYFLYGLICFNILILILYIINTIYLKKLNKNYKKFMKKIGNGNDIEEALKNYLNRVEDVQNKNIEIIKYCEKLKNEISICIKKVGMVRYSAFKDTGSDLSFALALLNDNNDGVLLNGIYSREMSNIYAKQIQEGKTSSKLSDEEKQALEIALNNKEK